MAAAAPDPNDDPNEFFNATDGGRGTLEHNTSFDDSLLEDDEKKFAQETETIFGTFLFKRLISDHERDSEDGLLDVAEIPSPVISSIREDMNTIEFDPDNDPKIIELGQMLASFGDEVHFFVFFILLLFFRVLALSF